MNADMAMYDVKEQGKNNYKFFNEKMTKKLKEQIQIEKFLREAIEEEQFKLVYQPQIATVTGKITGFEALLRLKNYFISPAVFIEIAEENGMIIQMGRWVTKEAIDQIARWKEKGLSLKPIAINFSAKQLNDMDYVAFLERVLKERQVDAKYIEIEITESIFLDQKEETIVFLNQLKNLGVKIALDDFGTGYSSLSYLTFLPVDKIKLDKSLCDKFLEIEHIAVMDNIISLAHSLNLEVVAEGVEEIEQYKRLRVAKCNYIQGYLFSKPLENFEAEKVYEDNFLEKKGLSYK
jgi:EAL domain-containing protein (putative c-di-GMP-specific phosphodiesterase class I)